MKKPSLKRKKEPTPQELAASPALRRKKEPKRKKEPTPQQLEVGIAALDELLTAERLAADTV